MHVIVLLTSGDKDHCGVLQSILSQIQHNSFSMKGVVSGIKFQSTDASPLTGGENVMIRGLLAVLEIPH